MKNGQFTAQERAYLAGLPAVEQVRATRITYAPWFMRHTMERYHAGDKPSQIFTDAGLSPAIIGYKRIERSIHRWKLAELKGTLGVNTSRTIKSRSQADTVKTQKCKILNRQRFMRENEREKYERRLERQQQKIRNLEAQVEVLKARIALAKKLRCAHKTLTKRDIFQLIQRAKAEHPEATITTLCSIMNVSRAGYYKWVNTKHEADPDVCVNLVD